MGPAVDEKQWKTDFDYIKIGQQEGARLVLGGKRPEHLTKGYFVEPTIFDNVQPTMRIFKEEIFGPVLSVSTANNLEEALQFANGVEYGLTTSIFTENIDTIMNFVEEFLQRISFTSILHTTKALSTTSYCYLMCKVSASIIVDYHLIRESLCFYHDFAYRSLSIKLE